MEESEGGDTAWKERKGRRYAEGGEGGWGRQRPQSRSNRRLWSLSLEIHTTRGQHYGIGGHALIK